MGLGGSALDESNLCLCQLADRQFNCSLRRSGRHHSLTWVLWSKLLNQGPKITPLHAGYQKSEQIPPRFGCGNRFACFFDACFTLCIHEPLILRHSPAVAFFLCFMVFYFFAGIEGTPTSTAPISLRMSSLQVMSNDIISTMCICCIECLLESTYMFTATFRISGMWFDCIIGC